MRPGTAARQIFPQPPALSGRQFSGKFPMCKHSLLGLLAVACLSSCARKPDPDTLVMIIESSPTNLDPRVGVDAQSERIDDLIFDDLLSRDERLNVKPGLAQSWEVSDPF